MTNDDLVMLQSDGWTVVSENPFEIRRDRDNSLARGAAALRVLDMLRSDASTSYRKLETELGKLPPTWYPALLRAMVEAAYRKNVFQPSGASRFVSNVESGIGGSAVASEVIQAGKPRKKLR